VKAGWEVKPLGEIGTLQRGFDLPKAQRTEGQFPLVTSSGPTDTHNIAKVKGPGVATGRSGSIGNVFFVEKDFWPLNTALYVKDFHGNDPRFVYYLLQLVDLGRFASGAGVPTLNRNDVHGELIAIPTSIEEQQRIVAVLDEAFDGLACARAHAEANLQNARELFERIKADALAYEGADSETVTLSEVVEIVSGLIDPREPPYIDMFHLGAGNMITGTDELVDIKTAKEEGLKSGKYLFDDETVLYSKIRPYLRKAARPDFDGLCSADVYPLRSKGKRIDRDFLFHLLLGHDFTEYAISGSDRAGMPKVNQKHLFAYQFNIPPVNEQTKIAAIIDEAHIACSAIVKVFEAKTQSIGDLRQSLLQKAFAGELT